MKRTLLISLAVLLLIVTAAVAAQRTRGGGRSGERSDEAPSAEQWEYLVVGGGNVNLSSFGNDQYPSMRKVQDGSFKEAFPLERNLDKLGAKGWELVTVMGDPRDPIYYLKRRVEGAKTER